MNSTKRYLRLFPWIAAAIYFAAAAFFLASAMLADKVKLPGVVGTGGTWAISHLHFGNASISLYWVAMGLGIIVMTIFCYYRGRGCAINETLSAFTGALLFVFGFLGAKLLYILEHMDSILQNGISLAGVSFFGTVFLLLPVIPLIGLCFHEKPLAYLDYCAPSIPGMLTFIRSGCFANGCCGGITVMFGENPVTIPVQLMEAGLDLLLMGFLLRAASQEKYRGKLYFLFMGCYGAFRFILEFVRDTPKTHLHLSNGQWFALISILIGAIGIAVIQSKNSKKIVEKNR